MIILNFVAGCIFNNKGEILLQRRQDKNKWGFPGGAIELGESAEIAIKREVKEETGLDVEVLNLIGIYTDYYDEYPNGDKAQCITILLKLLPTSEDLSCSDTETLELKYFPINHVPTLVNKQHEDFLNDLKNNKVSIIR